MTIPGAVKKTTYSQWGQWFSQENISWGGATIEILTPNRILLLLVELNKLHLEKKNNVYRRHFRRLS